MVKNESKRKKRESAASRSQHELAMSYDKFLQAEILRKSREESSKRKNPDDIHARTEKRKKEGYAKALTRKEWLEKNEYRIQASHYLRNMIKALEIHSWQNTVDDWQRYHEAKMVLKMRSGKARKNPPKASYIFYGDNGHLWLKVPRKMLDTLKIASEISYYSYQRGAYVYLEEALDANKFIKALRTTYGITPTFKEVRSPKTSRIRKYEHYKPQRLNPLKSSTFGPGAPSGKKSAPWTIWVDLGGMYVLSRDENGNHVLYSASNTALTFNTKAEAGKRADILKKGYTGGKVFLKKGKTYYDKW